jgi:hypothetical protein
VSVKLVQVLGDSPWMRQEVMQASGARALALGLRAGAVLLAEEGAVVVGPAHEDAPEEIDAHVEFWS